MSNILDWIVDISLTVLVIVTELILIGATFGFPIFLAMEVDWYFIFFLLICWPLGIILACLGIQIFID